MAGYALLFQLPLLMYVINRVTPLPPKTLLSAERGVILASFIVGAILTPTPDPVNQLILAGPMVMLYQVGIGTVAVSTPRQSHKRKPKPRPRQVAGNPIASQLGKTEAEFDEWFNRTFRQPKQELKHSRPVSKQINKIADIQPTKLQSNLPQSRAPVYRKDFTFTERQLRRNYQSRPSNSCRPQLIADITV